ncbi:MAG: xanthine dehydrogenase family protein subunit M [Rhizobiaceae bacterium]|nr:xanthine dehydrogenase family protein subunit M [Rhizobiaceae bacterium]
MIPGSFEYHRPASLDDAVGLISSLGDDALLVAGGHSLIPMMKLRMALPEHLIDLQDVQSLKSISIDGKKVSLGAMVTQSELIASDALCKVCPIIRETSLQIADPQIRNLGTIGGNVANGDPGNDMPAIMQVLGATYLLTGPNGEREIAAADFYEAAYFTARSEDEILTAICFDAPATGHGSAYLKQKRKIGDYATAAAGVILEMSGDKCSAASIGLTNVGDTPLLAEEASAILVGSSLDDDTIKKAIAAARAITDPASDGRGPREYRTHVAGIMVQRAIALARTRAA